MLNKIRLRIIQFFKKNEYKIIDLGKKLVIVAMVVLIATIIVSSFSGSQNEETGNNYNVYNPTDTIIKGSDVSKEKFEQDSNLVNTFLDLCNNKQVEDAYNMISTECKEEKYSTLEKFKEYYYSSIFATKRECNLQAWVSQNDYIIYKIRYTNDMLSTGTYDENDVYEDYITLNRKNETDKISIGSFVDSQKCNIVTKTEGIEAIVVNKKIYIDDEEYEIYVTNTTNKTILLDNLKSGSTIWLTGNGKSYSSYKNKLFVSNLKIQPEETQRIVIRFMKSIGSNSNSTKIKFKNVIMDYDAYMLDTEKYANILEIEINVED